MAIYSEFSPLKNVFFHSYVSWPEGLEGQFLRISTGISHCLLLKKLVDIPSKAMGFSPKVEDNPRIIPNHHLVMTNIAMENPWNKWRFLAGKIIYKWAIYTMAMLNNQRVIASENTLTLEKSMCAQ